jgi:ABC-type spermidine/putrescine transport system permease subunit II
VPFWTSNIIRMIAWIPFLGLNGVFNQSLLALGLIDAPLEFLLFSDVAVVIAYVHLLTLFMIMPIVNAMARIDPAVIEAAVDAGASPWRVIWNVVLPLSKSGMAGLAFRRRFVGSTLVFYLAVASLVMPGLLVGLGIGLMCQLLGLQPSWYTSGLGAQLTWTLPFGLLIMFAVFSRFNPFYEEAARDLGASAWQTLSHVVLPILVPGIIGVALFGFTLSYDEFARTLLTVGPQNTLPLEIWAMTTNVTSPALYALGTLTTAVSFLVITLALASVAMIQRRRTRQRLHARAGE